MPTLSVHIGRRVSRPQAGVNYQLPEISPRIVTSHISISLLTRREKQRSEMDRERRLSGHGEPRYRHRQPPPDPRETSPLRREYRHPWADEEPATYPDEIRLVEPSQAERRHTRGPRSKSPYEERTPAQPGKRVHFPTHSVEQGEPKGVDRDKSASPDAKHRIQTPRGRTYDRGPPGIEFVERSPNNPRRDSRPQVEAISVTASLETREPSSVVDDGYRVIKLSAERVLGHGGGPKVQTRVGFEYRFPMFEHRSLFIK